MINNFTEFKSVLEQLQNLNQANTDISKHLEIVSRKDCTFQQFSNTIEYVQSLSKIPGLTLPDGILSGGLSDVYPYQLAPSKKVDATLQYCKEYLDHLWEDAKGEKDTLALKKHGIVQSCIMALENKEVDAATQLANFNEIFNKPENRELLNTRRDSAAMTFLKGVLTVLSLGIAWAAGLWNTTGGNMSKSLDELADSYSPAP